MNHKINYLLIIILPLLWSSCSRQTEEILPPTGPVYGWEEGAVGFGTVSRSGGMYAEEDFLHNTFIHNESYLRIYNYTGSTLDFTDTGRYKWYVYDENLSNLTGNQYNFRPLEGRGFLWEEIKTGGSGYIFDAVVFPRFHTYRNEIYPDQQEFDHFLASDILMAHHIQDREDFGKRVAFKFHHVLTMLQVEIYVPKYDPKTNTGFEKKALANVVLPELYTKFTFNASAALTSDEAPTVTTHTAGNHPGDCPQTDIRMYPRYNVEDFSDVKEGKDKEGEEGRDCYIYPLTAILPLQIIDSDKTLLRVTLKTKEGVNKTYRYIPGKLSTPISFQAGHITYLKLTLSKEENKAFLIKAEVKPWGKASADMSLEKEENNQSTGK